MDSLLACEICEENFDHEDHRPRFLHCGHSLCSKCITESLKTNKGNLKCPFCRSSSDSANSKVTDFSENFTLLKMIDAEENKQKASASEKSKSKPVPDEKTCLNQENSHLDILTQNEIDSTLDFDEKTCLNQENINLEILRQIEIDSSLACISSCNDKLEELKKISENIQKEKDALDTKFKTHEIDVIETLDLLKRLESIMECIRLAKSAFGINMAAQDIKICKGIIQDFEKLALNSADPHIKDLDKINSDSPTQSAGGINAKLETTLENAGSKSSNSLTSYLSPFSFGSPAGKSRNGQTSMFSNTQSSSTPNLFGGKSQDSKIGHTTANQKNDFSGSGQTTFSFGSKSTSSLATGGYSFESSGLPLSSGSSSFSFGSPSGKLSDGVFGYGTSKCSSTPKLSGGESQDRSIGNTLENAGNVFGGSRQEKNPFCKAVEKTGTLGGNLFSKTVEKSGNLGGNLFSKPEEKSGTLGENLFRPAQFPPKFTFGVLGNTFGSPSFSISTCTTPSHFSSKESSAGNIFGDKSVSNVDSSESNTRTTNLFTSNSIGAATSMPTDCVATTSTSSVSTLTGFNFATQNIKTSECVATISKTTSSMFSNSKFEIPSIKIGESGTTTSASAHLSFGDTNSKINDCNASTKRQASPKISSNEGILANFFDSLLANSEARRTRMTKDKSSEGFEISNASNSRIDANSHDTKEDEAFEIGIASNSRIDANTHDTKKDMSSEGFEIGNASNSKIDANSHDIKKDKSSEGFEIGNASNSKIDTNSHDTKDDESSEGFDIDNASNSRIDATSHDTKKDESSEGVDIGNASNSRTDANSHDTIKNKVGNIEELSKHIIDITSDISEFIKGKSQLNESSYIKLPNNVVITKENIETYNEIFSFKTSNPENIQFDGTNFNDTIIRTKVTSLLKILNEKQVPFEIKLPLLLCIDDENIDFYADIFDNKTSSGKVIELNIKNLQDPKKFSSLVKAISVKKCEVYLFLQQQWRLDKVDTSDEYVTALSKTCSLTRFKGSVQNIKVLPTCLRELYLSLGPNVDLATLPYLHTLNNLKRLDICIDERTNASSLSPLPKVNPSSNYGNVRLYLPRVSDCQDWAVNTAKQIQPKINTVNRVFPEQALYEVLFPDSNLTPRGVEWLVPEFVKAEVTMVWLKVSSPMIYSKHNSQLNNFTEENTNDQTHFSYKKQIDGW